jgi:hypothetical protein
MSCQSRDHRDGTLRDHPSRVPGSGYRDNKTSNKIYRDPPGCDVSEIVNSGYTARAWLTRENITKLFQESALPK